jgi:cytochrome b561
MAQARYGSTAIALHWVIGAVLLAELVFGFLLDDIAPRGTPARAGVINLHKSIGVVLLALALLRLAWRARHPAPPWPATMSAWQRRAADWGHWAMYACMILMPLFGWTASNFSKYGVKFFGIALGPWGADMPKVYALFNGAHVATAYIFSALLAIHVLATLKHALINRDQVFGRVWPGPRC